MSVINQVLKDLDSRDKMTDEKPVEHFAVDQKPDAVDADWIRTGIWSLLLVIILSAAAYYYLLSQQVKAPVFYQPVSASLEVKKARPAEIEPAVAVEASGPAEPRQVLTEKPVVTAAVLAAVADSESRVTENRAAVSPAGGKTDRPQPAELVAYLPLKDDGKAIEPAGSDQKQAAPAGRHQAEEMQPEARSTAGVRPEITIVKSVKKPIDKARELITGGRLVEAESALKQMIKRRQISAQAYELLTAVQLRSNRLTDAGQTLNAALKVYPYNINLNLMQARILINQGKTDAAVNLLEKQLQAGEPSVKTMAMLAPLYQHQKQYAAAAGLYRQLLKKQPALGQNWMGLATNLDALGEHGNALSAYQRALQLGLSSTALQQYASERLRKLDQQASVNSGAQ